MTSGRAVVCPFVPKVSPGDLWARRSAAPCSDPVKPRPLFTRSVFCGRVDPGLICFHRVIHFSNLFEERFSVTTPLTGGGRPALTGSVGHDAWRGDAAASAALPFDSSNKGSKGNRVHGWSSSCWWLNAWRSLSLRPAAGAPARTPAPPPPLAVTQRRCDSLLFAGGFRAKLHNLQICASLRVTVFLNLVTQK